MAKRCFYRIVIFSEFFQDSVWDLLLDALHNVIFLNFTYWDTRRRFFLKQEVQYVNKRLLKCSISNSTFDSPEGSKTDMKQVMSDSTALYYPTQHLLPLHVYNLNRFCTKTVSALSICQLRSCWIECDTLNCSECSNDCVLKQYLVACKNVDFLKTHRSGCRLDQINSLTWLQVTQVFCSNGT
jgi:hypothetical protein